MQGWGIVLAAIAYLLFLFVVASYGDRQLVGRARDQQVRHPREVLDDRLARHVLAEVERDRLVVRAAEHLEQLAHHDHLALVVRHLDAHGVAARNRRDDADRDRVQGCGQVGLEAADLADLDALGQLDLVLRDRGALADAGRQFE